MKLIASLLVLLFLGCATKPMDSTKIDWSPSGQPYTDATTYTLSRDVDGNPIWTKHEPPPAKLGPSYAWMYVALTLATVADIESTRRAERLYPNGKEGNPVARWVLKRSGYGGLYAFSFSVNAIQMEVARRRKRNHERWLVGPITSSGTHLAGAAWNSR